jgi:hypothetical protein
LPRQVGPDGAFAALRQLKDQKVARFIGITGHNDGMAMAEALRRYDFDTVLMALNAAQSANPIGQRKMQPLPAFEQSALPVALRKKHGNSFHESHGPRKDRWQRHQPRLARRTSAIQFKPARRQRRHRLRANGAPGRKRARGAQLDAEQ